MMAAEHLQRGVWLSALLRDLADVPPGQDVAVQGIALDSRKVGPGYLFLACAGSRRHGMAFLDDALRAGTVAVLWEPAAGVAPPGPAVGGNGVPAVAVPSLAARAGLIAERFFGHPSRDLFTVGVAGTDGKTSCSHFLAQVLDTDESPCGVIGTLGNGRVGDLQPGTHTTPDAVSLHAQLADFRQQQFDKLVMEVSSHALDQGRAAGVAFDVALFTNLGRDHLDYHGSLEEYGRAKRRLFEYAGLTEVVLNTDDPFSEEIASVVPVGARVTGYGLSAAPSWLKERRGSRYLTATRCELNGSGARIALDSSWGSATIDSRLLGEFNVRNLLGVLGVALASGMAFPEAVKKLETVRAVPGRMETFGGAPGQPLVVVDYAHTPQALDQVLAALRPLCRGQLWCVVGAGGDRDRGKRPEMGAVAEARADRVILTDDNPRGEDPARIIEDIRRGMTDPSAATVLHDRARAIGEAITGAGDGDVVLVAGKGHETSQEVGGTRLPFDDREQVRMQLSGKGS